MDRLSQMFGCCVQDIRPGMENGFVGDKLEK